MRIKVDIELRRPARRSVALLLGVLLLTAPAVALASHQFPDVPPGQFHDEIGAIAEAGITAGFADGGYHPGDAVTRQAMAAFMHRGFGRVAHDGSTALNTTIEALAGSTFSTDVPAKEVTITVPGVANGFSPTQMVYVHANILLLGSMSTSSTVGCPCEFGATINDVTGNTFSPTAFGTFESSTTTSHPYSFVIDSVYALPPGPRAFRVNVTLLDRETATNSVQFTILPTSTLTAMTIPFGPAGTNDLSPESGED